MTSITLTDEQLDMLADALADRIADRLAERLAAPPNSAPGLVDAAELARSLGISRDTVYQHADELGAVRIGNGTRSRLRFDADKATARVSTSGSHQPDPPASAAPPRRRRQREPGSRVELLPITDDGTLGRG